MAFLNLDNKFIIYSDQSIENPKIRLADISDSFQAVRLSHVKSQEITLQPNSQISVANNQKQLSVDIDSVVFHIVRPISTQDIVRVQWSGIAPAPNFRTARAIGLGADSGTTTSRQGPRTMRITQTAGTAINTSTVQVNDIIKFFGTNDLNISNFPISTQNKEFVVVNKGVNFIDFNDEGSLIEDSTPVVLGPDFAESLKVLAPYSTLSPRPGDRVSIQGTDFLKDNQGVFSITDISDDYIEFVNPYGVEQMSIQNSAGGLYVFDRLIGFVYLVATGEIELITDSQPDGIKVQKLDGFTSLFFGSISASRVDIKNLSNSPVSVRAQYASTGDDC